MSKVILEKIHWHDSSKQMAVHDIPTWQQQADGSIRYTDTTAASRWQYTIYQSISCCSL